MENNLYIIALHISHLLAIADGAGLDHQKDVAKGINKDARCTNLLSVEGVRLEYSASGGGVNVRLLSDNHPHPVNVVVDPNWDENDVMKPEVSVNFVSNGTVALNEATRHMIKMIALAEEIGTAVQSMLKI